MTDKRFNQRTASIAGWKVRITSFRSDDTWHATVEETAAGARIARGSGPTAEAAEAAALDKAGARLAHTRVRPPLAP